MKKYILCPLCKSLGISCISFLQPDKSYKCSMCQYIYIVEEKKKKVVP